jgi:hypothetical protein
MKHLLLIAIIAVFGSVAKADVYFTPSLFYMKYDIKTTATTKTDLSIYNFKLGKTFNNNIYAGVVYDMQDENDLSTRSYGVGIGYINDGWNFHLTYFISSTYEVGTQEYTGTGMNFEIGYLFKLRSWALGPALTYRTFEYDEVDDVSFDPSLKLTRVLPYVMLQFKF